MYASNPEIPQTKTTGELWINPLKDTLGQFVKSKISQLSRLLKDCVIYTSVRMELFDFPNFGNYKINSLF